MTQDEALLTYCLNDKRARRVVGRLLAWDEGKTVKQNALAISLGSNWGYRFARRYKLKHKKGA